MGNLFESTLVRRMLVLIGLLILIPIIAIGTLAVTSESADPPSPFFGGGPLIAGELVGGPEPDWSFLGDVATIDLQLLSPPWSRAVWVADYRGADVIQGVSDELNRKYGFGGPGSIEAGTTWLFELAPRSSRSPGGSK